MQITHLTHFVILVGEIAAALGSIGAVIIFLWKMNKKFMVLHNAIMGTPAVPELAQEKMPSLGERFTDLKNSVGRLDEGQLHVIAQNDYANQRIDGLDWRVYRVELEFQPDHGNSTYDRITRIEAKIDQGGGKGGRHRAA